MEIVIDSNIIFSALIKNSITRRIILNYKGFFLFPEFIFEEIERHKMELFKKSGMTENEFNELLSLILKKVVIISNEVLNTYKKESIEIVKNIDINDATFIACALAHSNSIIWSDDKKLKNQNKIKVLNTNEIIMI